MRLTSNFFDYIKMLKQAAMGNDNTAGIQKMKNLKARTDTTYDEFKIQCATFRLKTAFCRAVPKLLGNFWATFRIWSNF